MSSRIGLGRPPLASIQAGAYTVRLTELTIVSDGWYRASRLLELVVDGQNRAAVFQTKKSDLHLQWNINPSVVVSPTAIIVVQPYEARTLIRRKRVNAVTIQGDVIHRAIAGKVGERHEYLHHANGFRITLSLAIQRDGRFRDKSQSTGVLDTPGEFGDISFGPPTAPNAWKLSLNAMNELKKVVPSDSLGAWTSARTALKSACEAMPTDAVDEDLQRLGEQIQDLLLHIQKPEEQERLHSQNATVSSFFDLLINASMCAEDYSKSDAKENSLVVQSRDDTLKNFARWFSRLKRNFNERKNIGIYEAPYRRESPRTPTPSTEHEAKSEVDSESESEPETRSVTGEEDDRLANYLDPQFTPTDLLDLYCLGGTREDYISKIISWLDDEKAPNILWLCGGPGTGKTCIAWSIIADLERKQRSASEFFFRRAAPHYASQLWKTTAFKLAKFHPAFKAVVVAALKNDSEVTDQIATTFEKLVAQPLRDAADHLGGKGPVFLIDGLDQCSLGVDYNELLATLPLWLELPRRCKLIITSRPQDNIAKTFEGKEVERLELLTGDDADYSTNGDVAVYLNHRFSQIKAQNKALPDAWPNPEDVQKIANSAAGFFHWARIAADTIAGAPDIERQFTSVASSGSATKFEPLDDLFGDLLNYSFGSEPAPTFRATMGAIALARAPLTMKDLQHLFTGRFGETNSVEEICAKLLPIVAIHQDDHHLSLRHRSIIEFLTDPKRVGEESPYYIDRSKTGRNFTVACLKIMQSGLKFNICGLKSSHESNDDVSSRTELVEKFIPSHLSYACKFWADHLRDVSDKRDNEIVNLLRNILHFRFLYWLEVLSLIDEVDIAPRVLLTVSEWLETSDKELSAFAADAGRFALTFRDPIAHSVPHIYVSALPLAPTDSRIYKHYKDRFPGTFSVTHFGGDGNGWPAMRFAFRPRDYVHNICLHPEGKRVVTALNDPVVQVWGTSTGTSLLKLTGHGSSVRTAVYSPSGKRIATGSDDKSIRIWDADTGALLYGPYEMHTDWVRSVSWSPDGTKLVSGSDDRLVKVITVETGVPLFEAVTVHTDWVRAVAFHPDGNHVISGSDDRTMRIWDAATGSLVATLEGHNGYIRAVAVSPDGKRLASGSDDCQIFIYDMDTMARHGSPITAHKGSIRGLAFSPDNKLLLSGSDDCTVRIWTAETGKRYCEPLQGHSAAVASVAFSPDMRQVFSGGEDASIRVWDMHALPMWRPTQESTGPFQTLVLPLQDKATILSADGAFIWKWQPDSNQVESLAFETPDDHTIRSTAFSADGTRVVTGGSDRNIYIWDASTGKPVIGPLTGHTDDIFGVAFSSDGRLIASGSDDNTVWVWDVETGESVCGPLQGQHNGSVRAVCFSPDGKHIASGSNDRTVVIWSIETGLPVHPIMQQHSDWVNALAYSTDGRYLASSSDDNTTLIWDVETGQVVLQPLKGHTAYVKAVAWSFDGKYIVTGAQDKAIYVFNVETGAVLSGPLYGHVEHIHAVKFSPDGSSVISASLDGTIRIWDIEPRSFSRSSTFSAHGDWVHCVALSPDSSYVASGGDDSTVQVQDVSTGTERYPALSSHEDWVREVCYSSDGELLASCSDDGTIRLWNGRTGERVGEPLRGHAGAVLSISFSPNGRRLVSGGEDSTVRLWDVTNASTVRQLKVVSAHSSSRDINSVAFSPDGSQVVSASAAGDIIVYDVVLLDTTDLNPTQSSMERIVPSASLQPRRTFEGQGAVLSVAFAPDGNRLVSAGDNTPTRVWDVFTGETLVSIANGHTGPVRSVLFSPDGKQIISGGEDATIRIWDAESGAALSMPLRGHSNKILSVDVSSDGQRLVSGSADNSVAVWELNLDRRVTWPESFTRHKGGVEFCAVDEEGIFCDNSTLEDGWVRGAKSEALFWIPPTYRKGLWMPQTLGVMGAAETVVDLRRYKHGTAWTYCQEETSKS
ncbi:WD40 repeat-like protein [Auriscalpium vulgare]|uniref:WD40 repeat-like protein n=1 Tax=Auriscalpium vulgare TaxID=40419 RepID=A0ACB8RXX2_9AGAM|nr:WD40 repeat-like protein [Auriscalpium vulgare]